MSGQTQIKILKRNRGEHIACHDWKVSEKQITDRNAKLRSHSSDQTYAQFK